MLEGDMFKDMFGEEIKVGDYLAYAELNGKTAVQNIRKVTAIDKSLHTVVVKTFGWNNSVGSTKKIQCAGEKAIILKDFKEDV